MLRPNRSAGFFILVALFLGFELRLFAAEVLSSEKAEALRKRFETQQQETRFWTADFTQTLTVPGLKTPIVSEGKIRYRAPDSLRIDFEKPSGDFLLALGSDLYVQKSERGLVRKTIQADTVGKPLLGLLGMLRGRPTEDAERFDIQAVLEGDAFEIELVKKQGAPAQLPKKIINSIAVHSLVVRNVTVVLPNGGTLAYAFRSSTRNRPVSASFFEPPEVH
jgi:outer membrane lipoprotein-sorting protein